MRAFDMDSSDTIGMLKEEIQEKLGILVRKQVIVHGRKKLRNDNMVGRLGPWPLLLLHKNSVFVEETYNSSDDPDENSSSDSDSWMFTRFRTSALSSTSVDQEEAGLAQGRSSELSASLPPSHIALPPRVIEHEGLAPCAHDVKD